jgi:hypothetical protein
VTGQLAWWSGAVRRLLHLDNGVCPHHCLCSTNIATTDNGGVVSRYRPVVFHLQHGVSSHSIGWRVCALCVIHPAFVGPIPSRGPVTDSNVLSTPLYTQPPCHSRLIRLNTLSANIRLSFFRRVDSIEYQRPACGLLFSSNGVAVVCFGPAPEPFHRRQHRPQSAQQE